MPVGYRTGRLDDTTRTNWDGTGPRPLTWAAWYPTSDDTNTRAHLLGPPDDPWFSIGHSAADAPLIPTPLRLPLVMLSHGTGGSALGIGWLGQRLAAHGFVAIGINHHGNTLAEPYRAEGFLCWWERARDLSFLLDQLPAPFANRIDGDRIYVAGYSLGGATAAALTGAITEASRFQRSDTSRDFARGTPEFPDLADHLPGLLESSALFRASWARMSDDYRDQRFKAALLLAPGRGMLGFNEASLATVNVPMRIIVGGADPALPAARWLHARLRSCTLDVLSPDVGHYVFLPEATASGRRAHPTTGTDAEGVDRRAVHDHVTTAAITLFSGKI